VASGADLDREFLEELLDGDREFASELFETYSESADSAYSDAELRLASGDVENAYRPFHTLKGASASVGLTSLQELARTLEVRAKAGELQECQEMLPQLRLAIDQAKSILKTYLETLP
jgi:HPt (histidine-containing phosphotransfer) domain-containing protein